MKVRCKDVSIFINGSVLNHLFTTFVDVVYLTKSTVQEIDLQVERPTLHVFIKVVKIRIIVGIFEVGCPVVVFRQQLCEGGFT